MSTRNPKALQIRVGKATRVRTSVQTSVPSGPRETDVAGPRLQTPLQRRPQQVLGSLRASQDGFTLLLLFYTHLLVVSQVILRVELARMAIRWQCFAGLFEDKRR